MELDGMYRDLVESSPDGIWVIDLTGSTLYANPALARMYGVPVDRMREVTVFDTLDEAGRRQFREHLEDVRAGRLNGDAQECLFHRKDGSSQWLLVQESPYRDAEGALVGVVHRLFDYGRRREMTQALEESRQQLAEAQRIARVGSYWWDVEADEIQVSDQLIEIFEMPDPSFPVTYREFLEFTHPDDRAGVDAAVQETVRTGERFTFLARVGEEGRGWIWARGRGVGRRGPDGTVVALEGTLQNVTETVEQEQALRDQVAQNRLMQAVATAANEASSLEEVLAQGKHLVLLHDDWRRARGFSLRDGELVPIYLEEADRLPDLADPHLLESDLRLARSVLETRDLVWDEARLTVAFPVFLREELVAVLAITSDPPLYRHEMIEGFVRQVAAQLSQVALREVTTRQMEEARDAAMAASQQKSDFLAMVSHEIRTPLNGVIGLNELLLQTDLDEEQRKLATGAGLSGRLLLSLINDILDFSKIEAGQLKLERLDFHVREMFEQLLGAHSEAADQKGVTLRAEYDDGLPEVLCGDPTRVAQVVNNLVSNAVKFTDEGSVSVRVGATRDHDGWLLRCEVEDTGIGIDPAVDDLFEPFKQADTSTSRRFGGTGLGLAISRELVTLAGGEIDYESAPGQGSTFHFTMRMRGASGNTVLSRPPVTTLRSTGPAARILLVEDNPVNRMVAVGMLQALGHETDSAEDGLVALGLLQEHAYDAVLLDVQMPRLDGYATARAIREGERHSGAPRLPIIALTAAAIDGERERCLQAGMDDFLTKPMDPGSLAAALGRWLGATDGSREVEAPTMPKWPPGDADGRRTDEPPHLDLGRLRVLHDLLPDSTAYLDRAVDNFVRNSQATEQHIRTSLQAQDAAELGFHAHSLKGSAANLGLVRVAEVAELLQRVADGGELADAPVLVEQLAQLLRVGRHALQEQRAAAYADPATA